MLLSVWIALAFSVVVVAAGVAFAVTRGLGTWRTFRGFRRRAFGGLGELTGRIARVETRLDAAGENAARLERAQAELHESLAAARTLSAALAEVRATVSRVTGIVPSK